jgi:chloramphenicol 3-O-phosphotransferase
VGEVIWINGAFSTGKTTVARLLVDQLGRSFLLDPESIGSVLRDRLVPPSLYPGDYQDLDLWRTFTREAVKSAAARLAGFVIVPMTVAKPEYFDEIVSRLRETTMVHHFTLVASKETILRRELMREDNTGGWAARTADSVLPALEDGRFAVHLDAELADAATLAEKILRRIRSELADK